MMRQKLASLILSCGIVSTTFAQPTTSIDINTINLKNIDTTDIQVVNGVATPVKVHKPKEACAVTIFMNGIVHTVTFHESDRRFTQGFVPNLATDPNSYSTSLDPKLNLFDLVKLEVENAPNCDQIIIAQSQGGLRATAYAQIMDKLGVGDRIKAIIYIGSPVRGWSALASGVPALKSRMNQHLFQPLSKAKSAISEIAPSDLNRLFDSITKQLGDSADSALALKATNEMLDFLGPNGSWATTYMGIQANYISTSNDPTLQAILDSSSATYNAGIQKAVQDNQYVLQKDSLFTLIDSSKYFKVLPPYIKVGFVVGDESNLGVFQAGNSTLVQAGCVGSLCWPNLNAKDLTSFAYANSNSIFGIVATLNRGAWTAESAMSAAQRANSVAAKAASTSWKALYYSSRAACFWFCDPSWMMDNANREWDNSNRYWDDANYHETLAIRKWNAIGNAEASGPWFGELQYHLSAAYQSVTHDGLIPTFDQYRKIEEFGGSAITTGDYVKISHSTHYGNHNASETGNAADIWGTDLNAGWEHSISSTDGIIANWYDENIRTSTSPVDQNAWQMARYNTIVNY